MKLIVGLGNPGKEYEKTKHNAGFMCVDTLLSKLDAHRPYKKWQAIVTEARVGTELIYLVRPQTYMNLSGQAVKEAVHALGIDVTQDLILVYDDLDLPIGSVRLRQKGSAGGHNGVKSVVQQVGSGLFPRIRIGIGRPPFDITVIDYVLTPFPKKDRELVAKSVELAAEAAHAACESPFQMVMNKFNSRASTT